MSLVRRLIGCFLLLVTLGGGLSASDNGTGLLGTYFPNEMLSGAPAVSRLDAQVDFTWASGAPAVGLPVDSFSARWDGEIEAVNAESLTLIARTDDGVRLWLDGRLVIDAWVLRGATDSTCTFTAEAGRHYRIRMEYYEHFGSAVAQLLWQSASIARAAVPTSRLYPVPPSEAPAGTGSGLLARYFANETLSGAPAVSRTDVRVDFDWGGNAPDAAVPVDGFSARWDGEIEARYTEPTTLVARTDDGVRVWLDGILVIDAWVLRSAADSTYTFSAEAGHRYRVRMEYYEHTGAAVARLWWRSTSEFEGPIPTSQLYPTPANDPPNGTGTGLLARFYANETLSGAPSLSRTDSRVDFDWAGGSPGVGVPTDSFSARWDGELEPRTSEPLTLILRTDDGVRLWLDDQLVINAWILRGAADSIYTFSAQAGHHYRIRIDYFEHTGSAVAKLWWQSPSEPQGPVPTSQLYPTAPVEPPIGTGTGLAGSYFANETLTGTPALTRLDPVVDFDWAGGTPGSPIPSDSFSARWDGEFEPRYSEPLTLIARTDDGVRVWIDDQLVINAWILRGAADSTATFPAVAGQHYRIRMEYYEHQGSAVAKLWWQSAHELKCPIPSNQLYPPASVQTPVLGFAAAASSVSEKAGSTMLALTLSPASGTPVTVSLQATGSGASVPASLTIPAGQTTASIPVTVQDDPRYGPDRQVTIALANPVGALLGQTTHVLTVLNTDAKPTIGFTASTSFNLENSGTAAVIVRLSAVSAVPTTVSIQTAGSATAGADYTAPAATLQIPADTIEGTIFIPLLPDALAEPDEQLVLTLANPIDAVLGGITVHTLTISDGLQPPAITQQPHNASALVGDAATFTVTATGSQPLAFAWQVSPDAGMAWQPAPGANATPTYQTPVLDLTADAASYRVIVTNPAGSAMSDTALLSVSRRPQSITFAALAAKTVGDAAQTLTATATSGLPVSYTSSNPTVASVTGTTATILTAGTTTITANQAGDATWAAASPVSQVLTVSAGARQPQTITFVALPFATVGDAPITLTATASSGLPVSYTSSNPDLATVNGTTLTVVAGGVVFITAQQNGDATYDPAPAVTQTLSVRSAPQVTYVTSTTSAATVIGPVPDGLSITSIVATVTTPAAGVSSVGTLANGMFYVQVTNATTPVTQFTVSLAFGYGSDAGPSSQQTIPFGTATGDPYSSGDPTAIPPTPPTPTVTIVGGLTGKQQDTVSGKLYHFTKNTTVSVRVDATTSPGTITQRTLLLNDGRSFDATAGPVDVDVTTEGTIEFTASATATNGDLTSAGFSGDVNRLISDRTPPRFIFTMRKDYWPPEYDRSANPPPFVPQRHATGGWRDVILLNGNGDAVNADLRRTRGLNAFDQAGFTLEATIDDASGLDSGAMQHVGVSNPGKWDDPAPPPVPADPLHTAILPPSDPNADEPQRVSVSGFDQLPESVHYHTNVTQPEAYDTYVQINSTGLYLPAKGPTSSQYAVERSWYLGEYLCRFQLTDRAGNVSDESPLSVMVKTSKPVSYSQSESSMTSPARTVYLETDLAESWQNSIDAANRMLRFDQVYSGEGGVWRVSHDVALQPGSSTNPLVIGPFIGQNYATTFLFEHPTSASFFMRDCFGNQSDAATTKQIDLGFRATEGLGEPLEYFYAYSADTGITSDKIYFGSAFGGPPRSATFAATEGQASEGIYQMSVGGGNATPSTDGTFVRHFGEAGNLAIVSPIEPGTGAARRSGPAVITLPPSWNPNGQVDVRASDAGIRERLSHPAQVWLSLEPQAGGFPVSGYGAAEGSTTVTGTLPIYHSLTPGMASFRYEVGPEEFLYEDDSDEVFTSHYTGGGPRWTNLIRATPDVVATGSRVTIRIEAGFIDQDWSPDSFDAMGDYVHFRTDSADLTNTRAAYSPSADPETTKNKIAITGQRLIATGPETTVRQELELDLAIGSAIPAALYHIDVNLGAVKAYSDVMSAANAGANGAHRMKEALAVVSLAYETTDSRSATTIKKSQSIPHLSMDSFSAGDVTISGNTATIHVSGTVNDKMAGIVQTSVMSSIYVLDGGKPVGTISMSSHADDTSDFAPYAKHFTFSGSVVIPATPGNHEMELITDANEMGISTGARFSVQMDATYPNPLITDHMSLAFTVSPTSTIAGVISLSLPSGGLFGSTMVTLTETAPASRVFVDSGNIYELRWLAPAAFTPGVIDSISVQIKKNGALIKDPAGLTLQQWTLIETGVNTLAFVLDQVHAPAITGPTALVYTFDLGSGLSSTQVNQITLQLPENLAGSDAPPVMLTESAIGSRIFNGTAGNTPIVATFGGQSPGSTLQASVSISGTPVVSATFAQVGSTSQYRYQTTITSDAPTPSVTSASIGDTDQGEDTWEPYRIRFSAPSGLIDDAVSQRNWYHNGIQVTMIKKDQDYYAGDAQPRVMVDPVIIPGKVPGDPKDPDQNPPPTPVVGGDLVYSGKVTKENGGTFNVTITVKRSRFPGEPTNPLHVFVYVAVDSAGKKDARVDLDVPAILMRPPQLDVMSAGSYEGDLPIVKESAAAANARGQKASGLETFAAEDPRSEFLADGVKAWDVVPALDGTPSWAWNPGDNQRLPPPILWTIPDKVSGVPQDGYSLRSAVQIALIGQDTQIDDTTDHKQRTVIDALTVFVASGGIGNLTTLEAVRFYTEAMKFVKVYEKAEDVPAGATYRKGDVKAEFREKKNGPLDMDKVVANYNSVVGTAYLKRLAEQSATIKQLGLHFDPARMQGPQAFVAVFSFWGQLTDPVMLCGALLGGEGIVLPAAEDATWAAAAWDGGFLLAEVYPVGRLFGKGKALFRKVENEAKLPPHKPPASIAGINGGGNPWHELEKTVDPSVIRQVHPEACGPTCGAMLLRGNGTVAFQSALALRQKKILTSGTTALAKAMNELEGKAAWATRDGVIEHVIDDPNGIFSYFNKNGSFMTSLRVVGMQYSHMVVIDGKDALGRVIVRDPADATRYLLEWGEFLRVWEGQAIWRVIP